MNHPLTAALAIALTAVVAGPASAQTASAQGSASVAKENEAQAANPLFATSPLPLRYPQFDKLKDEHFAPAFDAGMAQELQEIAAIANQRSVPTFENTILALEKSGQLLSNARRIFGNLNGTDTNDARKKINNEYAPKFAAHRDAIMLNPQLFQRVETVYNKRNELGLDAEGLRLVEEYYDGFVRSGAKLADADKARLKEINARMAALGTQFSNNVLDEVNDSAVLIDDVSELAGLSESQIATAAAAAKAKGHDGKYLLTLLNTTGQPLLPQLDNRATRERVHKASVARGSRGNQWDNTGIVAEVLKLRGERSALLGYDTPAAFTLADETAGTVQAVNEMLGRLAPAAVANARREGAALQAMIDREQAAKGEPSFQLEPWDWAYYTEKVRQAEYDFDDNQLKPYFEMKNVLENGVFFAATELYGITFKERTDLPKYHADTWTYDVFDKDGKPLSIFIFDPYARPSKRGGAWMNSYVGESELEGTLPVVANHQNIPKPPAGEPTLLTWDEVTTMFHEFGHALHGMFSDVKYPYFFMNVPRDFVEFPSQVNEMWADWPSILANYAKHHQTGEPLPQALLDKKMASATFNEGFATTEYLGAAMLDQYLHQLPKDRLPTADQIVATEAAALKAAGLDYAPVPPRYRTTYFSHIMGGYAAAYYAYIWSEVLDANTVEYIKANGGLKRENGDRLRETLLSRGGAKDAKQLFVDFTGHEPKIEPLLKKRGLDAPAAN
ncbi:M3 family metallopeptidase [Luteimonas sp. SDU101]|uniref:M3 family metallopeptidase n=1 Tax=Luteimonas sp. SDU101 TaxID=3422593 RepID=UPI003EC0F683